MTNQEYLQQAYRLDNKINSDIEELRQLREMVGSISSLQYGERVQSSRRNDAPFVRSVEKIIILEEKINKEISTMVDLKEQIRNVIDGVENTDEQMVLRYRYIHDYTWEEIGDELHANKVTVWRWHKTALNNLVLPENAIEI